MGVTRYSVRQERPAPPWRPPGWFAIRHRPGRPGQTTTTWHPTWQAAMETANWQAHYGKGH